MGYHSLTFMMEGILKTREALKERGIKFVIEKVEDPALAVIKHCKNACALITDRGYLKYQRAKRKKVAFGSEVAVFQVEGDVVVPVEVASEFPSAWTNVPCTPTLEGEPCRGFRDF